jgi:hypothetical protein
MVLMQNERILSLKEINLRCGSNLDDQQYQVDDKLWVVYDDYIDSFDVVVKLYTFISGTNDSYELHEKRAVTLDKRVIDLLVDWQNSYSDEMSLNDYVDAIVSTA